MFRRKNRQPKPKSGDLRIVLISEVDAHRFEIVYTAEVQRFGLDDYGIPGWYPHGRYRYRSLDPETVMSDAKVAVEMLMGLERPKIIRVP